MGQSVNKNISNKGEIFPHAKIVSIPFVPIDVVNNGGEKSTNREARHGNQETCKKIGAGKNIQGKLKIVRFSLC